MAATKVTLNHAWFRDFLKSGDAREIVKPPAERVLAAARDMSPVDTGAYRDSLHIEEGVTDRVVERVATGVDYGMVIEARENVLRRALDAI